MNKKLEVFILIVVGLFTIIIIASLSSPEEAAQKAREQSSINYSSSDEVDVINNIIDGIGNFEVTVWDSKNNLISEENSNYPYEIIVNANYNSSIDCLYAKSI